MMLLVKMGCAKISWAMGKKGFRDLIVWQEAKELAVQIYRISTEGLLGRDFALRDQMRRAAVSIASNIAEGDERDTDKDAIRFFYMAKGSLAGLLFPFSPFSLSPFSRMPLLPIAHRPWPIAYRP